MDPEGELLEGLRAGRAAAYAAMVRRYNQRLYRSARAVLRDDAEAEDVVQETYVLAVAHLSSFRGDAALGTWLLRIALREAFARARSRRRAALLRHNLEAGKHPPTPERSAYDDEVRRAFEAAIDALPERLRLVFVLRSLDGMSIEDTAAVLGIAHVTVKVRLFRARAMLRRMLAKRADVDGVAPFEFAGQRCERIAAAVLPRLALAAHSPGP